MSLKKAYEQTQSIYVENAKEYDEQRDKSLFEKIYLEKFLSHLPENSSLLDLGCGAGEPIAKFLIENGHKVTGFDYSAPMLDLARSRFPTHEWIQGDMRQLGLEKKYDGIVSWGAFFHLNIKEQRQALPQVLSALKENGVVMITVGHDEGEVLGKVNGKDVYHSSLSKKEYTQILNDHDCEVLEFNLQDLECHGFSIFLAKKNPCR